jgi:hypothetical protein
VPSTKSWQSLGRKLVQEFTSYGTTHPVTSRTVSLQA